ncbi:MAG: Smr/MutS family protein [Rhizobiaceae bacterium]
MTGNRNDDDELWEKVKRTAKPLFSNRASDSAEPIVVPNERRKKDDQIKIPRRIVKPYHDEPPVSFAPAVKPKLLDEPTRRKISKGKLEIEARVDLHGMTQVQAHSRLRQFLENAYNSEKRTVLVITGKGSKGEGILRNSVPRWLDELAFRKITIGFHEASISHGGNGALYVRIRRKKAE